jgi:cyclopropane-fatty-acyl-phospholipid synthase
MARDANDWQSVAGYSQRPTRAQTDASPVLPFDRWALAILQYHMEPAPVRFTLWDGSEAPTSRSVPPIGRIVIKNRVTLFRILRNSDLYLGESYTSGQLDVQGDLVAIVEAVDRAMLLKAKPRRWSLARLQDNSLTDSRRNIHHHYDLGNDFYRLWLDDQLLYTCAYFPSPSDSLETAQIAKMDRVCQKLDLKPGESVVEAGCGWGAFALHMARRYGAQVRAFNISREQIAYARRRAQAEGLSGLVEFIEDDYRNISKPCDVFVSIGMLEHVGPGHYEDLGRLIDRVLHAEHGRGLLHFIGRNQPGDLNAWIRRRIFPGAYPPTIGEAVDGVLQPWNFSVLDVENLRLHYAKTLEHWRTRFEAATDRIESMFDDAFVRAWRLYLAGSEAAFITGWLQLFQILFARGTSNEIPWTRMTDRLPPRQPGPTSSQSDVIV